MRRQDEWAGRQGAAADAGESWFSGELEADDRWQSVRREWEVTRGVTSLGIMGRSRRERAPVNGEAESREFYF